MNSVKKLIKNLSYLMVVSNAIMLVACTKADPKLDAGTSLSLKLDTTSAKISATTEPFQVTGDCDKRMSAIEISINNGAWANVTSLASAHDIKCSSTKRFSFTLDPSSSAVSSYLGFVANVIDSKKIKIRGKTVVGSGKASDFTVTYEPIAIGPEGQYLTSGHSNGQRFVSSATYKLQGRIGVQSLTTVGDNTSSTSSYVLKSGMQRSQ